MCRQEARGGSGGGGGGSGGSSGARRGVSQGFNTACNPIRVSRSRVRARAVLGCGGALPVFALAIGMSCSSLEPVLSCSEDQLKARKRPPDTPIMPGGAPARLAFGAQRACKPLLSFAPAKLAAAAILQDIVQTLQGCKILAAAHALNAKGRYLAAQAVQK